MSNLITVFYLKRFLSFMLRMSEYRNLTRCVSHMETAASLVSRIESGQNIFNDINNNQFINCALPKLLALFSAAKLDNKRELEARLATEKTFTRPTCGKRGSVESYFSWFDHKKNFQPPIITKHLMRNQKEKNLEFTRRC